MKIKVADLKDFLKKSNKIKSNGIIPIHDYLLIEFEPSSVSITKNNGNMFCKHTVEEENKGTDKLLVEEKRLIALVNNAKGEFISFKKTGKKIVLKDDVNELKLEQPKEIDVNIFQTLPNNEGAEKTILTPDVLAAIFEARNFCSILECNLHFVYLQQIENFYCVFATNQHTIYQRKFEAPLPQLSLSVEVASIVSTLQHVEYFTAGNYDFFDTGRTVYGFIKSDYKAPDYMHIIRSINNEETMTFSKEQLSSFCALVGSLAVKQIPIIKFDDIEEAVLAHYDEVDYNTESEKKLDVEKNFPPKPFALNCNYLSQILKCFTTESVVLSPGQNERIYSVTHTEEKGLTILICPVMY